MRNHLIKTILKTTTLSILLMSCTQITPPKDSTIKVSHSLGLRQCEDQSKTAALAQLQQQLQQHQIAFFTYELSDNGAMYPAVCGGATGDIGIFTIQRSQLKKAQNLGFQAFDN